MLGLGPPLGGPKSRLPGAALSLTTKGTEILDLKVACRVNYAEMIDQIYQHLGSIFVGWMAVLGAVALTAAFTGRRWLERISIGVGVVLLAIPILYLAGLILWSLAPSPGAISPMQR